MVNEVSPVGAPRVGALWATLGALLWGTGADVLCHVEPLPCAAGGAGCAFGVRL